MNPVCPHCGRDLTLLQRADGMWVEVCPDCWFDVVFRYNSGTLIERSKVDALVAAAKAAIASPQRQAMERLRVALEALEAPNA